MTWPTEIFAQLAAAPSWGYAAEGPGFSEPTALASLALHAAGNLADAARGAEQLCDAQNSDGSVGIYAGHPEPGWPTGWAVLAWSQLGDRDQFVDSRQRAVAWLLELRGETLPPSDILGHDVTLVGWPWVRGTHSWVEPTAVAVLGLRAAGHNDHPRVQEAERLLLNRQLPAGGFNYGNTTVLDQTLLAHAQPSALALWALSPSDRAAVQKTKAFLQRQWPEITGVSSICYTIIALAAQGVVPPDVDSRLEAVYRQLRADKADSGFYLALIALAHLRSRALEPSSPQVTRS